MVKSLLEKHNISYKSSGKNIGKEWISITCPECFDDRGHFGISLKHPVCSCFLCGYKSSVSKLISKLLRISYKKADKLVKECYEIEEEEKEETEPDEEEFFKLYNSFGRLRDEHKNYLLKRNFDPDFIERKYLLKASDNFGSWKYRIIIPLVFNGKVKNFVGRDITDKQEIRYRYCSDEISLLKRSKLWYDNNNGRSDVILVEGIFDSWRIGEPSIALLSTQFTKFQIVSLLKRRFNRIFILFDADDSGKEKASELSYLLSSGYDNIEILELESGDPADLSENDVKSLKKELKI